MLNPKPRGVRIEIILFKFLNWSGMYAARTERGTLSCIVRWHPNEAEGKETGSLKGEGAEEEGEGRRIHATKGSKARVRRARKAMRMRARLAG